MNEIYLNEAVFEKKSSEKKIAYSIKEVAQLIGVSKGHLRNENQRGKLRFIKSGKRILITGEDLHTYLQGGSIQK
jgi:excisionase family DNA binding protein